MTSLIIVALVVGLLVTVAFIVGIVKVNKWLLKKTLKETHNELKKEDKNK